MLHSALRDFTFIILSVSHSHFLSHVHYKIKNLGFEPLSMKYPICFVSSECGMWHRKHGKEDDGIIIFFGKFKEHEVHCYMFWYLYELFSHLVICQEEPIPLQIFIYIYIFRKQDLSLRVFLCSVWYVFNTPWTGTILYILLTKLFCPWH